MPLIYNSIRVCLFFFSLLFALCCSCSSSTLIRIRSKFIHVRVHSNIKSGKWEIAVMGMRMNIAISDANEDGIDPYVHSEENFFNDKDYGVTWIHIPDGNGVPCIANLTVEHSYSKRNIKHLVYFELYRR